MKGEAETERMMAYSKVAATITRRVSYATGWSFQLTIKPPHFPEDGALFAVRAAEGKVWVRVALCRQVWVRPDHAVLEEYCPGAAPDDIPVVA